MAKTKTKTKLHSGTMAFSIESPTWGQLRDMAHAVIKAIGGTKEAASQLTWESYYTLVVLDSLNLDETKSKAFIFGRQYLTSDEEE